MTRQQSSDAVNEADTSTKYEVPTQFVAGGKKQQKLDKARKLSVGQDVPPTLPASWTATKTLVRFPDRRRLGVGNAPGSDSSGAPVETPWIPRKPFPAAILARPTS